MKETLFYQVRQDSSLPLTELSLFAREAFTSLYPGTSFDQEMTALYGSENSFFLSRANRTESIAVFVTPEKLDADVLTSLMGKIADAERYGRQFRYQIQNFLVSIVAAEISKQVKTEIAASRPGWSLFEYMLLHSETEEGFALKPARFETYDLNHNPGVAREAAQMEARPLSAAQLPDRRLSPEELNALIDLSLGLEMRSRGMDGPFPISPAQVSREKTPGSCARDKKAGYLNDIDA